MISLVRLGLKGVCVKSLTLVRDYTGLTYVSFGPRELVRVLGPSFDIKSIKVQVRFRVGV